MKTPIQDLAENLVLGVLNTGILFGFAFAHADSAAKGKAEAIVVQAGGPIPQLDGPRGVRVQVTVTIRSPLSPRCAALQGECLARLTSAPLWRSAALSAGMTTADDLTVLDEEIGGDRADGKLLRKRTITIPLLVTKK